jgi:hypothetical protein
MIECSVFSVVSVFSSVVASVTSAAITGVAVEKTPIIIKTDRIKDINFLNFIIFTSCFLTFSDLRFANKT